MIIKDIPIELYLFSGEVLSEGSPISVDTSIEISDFRSKQEITINISIVLNNIAVWAHSKYEWYAPDLKNIIVKTLYDELELIGYITGCAYELYMGRVISKNVNPISDVDVLCVSNQYSSGEYFEESYKTTPVLVGSEGVLLNRCFNNLVLAMKHPVRKNYYCYQALDSLRSHCQIKFELRKSDTKDKWENFISVSSCTEHDIKEVEDSVGQICPDNGVLSSGNNPREIFEITWSVIGSYIKNGLTSHARYGHCT
jgi:hypothetical protein